jgi:KDO2-lipid IV(A) lauroyltransferase
MEGEEMVEKAFKKGKGVIFIAAHLGNWELMAACYALNEHHPVSVIARSIYDERVNRILLKFRSRYGVKTILRGKVRRGESITASTKEILRVLRRNELLGIVIDQNIKGIDSVPVTFLGIPTTAPSGAASLARASQAEVFFGSTHRGHDNQHHNTSLFTRLIEEKVREFPSQWVWIHDRWGKYRRKNITANQKV